MKYHVYHYSANFRDEQAGRITEIDGIARMIKPINSMDGYLALKKAIIEDVIKSPMTNTSVIIASLSFLGVDDDDPA